MSVCGDMSAGDACFFMRGDKTLPAPKSKARKDKKGDGKNTPEPFCLFGNRSARPIACAKVIEETRSIRKED